MPRKAQEVLAQNKRYTVLYGGRGSGKSFAIANYLIAESLQSRQRILCAREMMNSIRDSVHRLLCDRIYSLDLDTAFDIGKDSVVCKTTGSDFLFKGLHANIAEIKSLQGITRCWVEESERVSQESLDILIPTIREENSRLFFTFNPEDENAPCYKKFVLNTPSDCAVAKVNYEDNDLFPEILRKELEYDRKTDMEKFLHIWMGECKGYANALIFKNKFRMEDFQTPDDAEFKYGADWGFANDPTALVRMFIQDHKLFIDYEAYGVGVEIEETPMLFDHVPESRKWLITADSARPETISHMRRQGFNIVGAIKGQGSVEDGIEFLRSFEEIIIHPRCPHAFENFNNYKWKQDRITSEILPIPVDSSNHVPDACRYALESYIRSKKNSILWI